MKPAPAQDHPARFLIVGLGNLLMRDDGVGVHAARALAEAPPPATDVIDIGTAILHAQPFLETAERVLAVDAMEAGGEPGSIYLCRPDELTDRGTAGSMHRLGLLESLRFLSPDRPPPDLMVLGVEPAAVEYGMTLTPPVLDALPRVLRAAMTVVQGWREGRPIAAWRKKTDNLIRTST